ncbi:cache domain-containing protein [Candidatus Saccharibacteria bacterium]|nr:cache domain-containing protein [Candidatus Saccharibacteria bacterium]
MAKKAKITNKSRATKKSDDCSRCRTSQFCAIFAILTIGVIGIIGNTFVLRSANDDLRGAFNHELRTAVEIVTSNVNTIYDRYSAGELSRSDAFDLSLTIVRESSWNDGQRGFWAIDRSGTLLAAVEGDPNISYNIGDNVIDEVDGNGLAFWRAFIDEADQTGGGYVNFFFNGDSPRHYLGYTMPNDFDFIITASYDLETFDRRAFPLTLNALWWSVLFIAGFSLIAVCSFALALARER